MQLSSIGTVVAIVTIATAMGGSGCAGRGGEGIQVSELRVAADGALWGQIDSLTAVRERLAKELAGVTEQLDRLEQELVRREVQRASESGFEIELKSVTWLRTEPSWTGVPIARLSPGTRVRVLGYEYDGFRVAVNDQVGYVLSHAFPEDPRTNVLREEGAKEYEKKLGAEAAAESRAQRAANEERVRAAIQEYEREQEKGRLRQEESESRDRRLARERKKRLESKYGPAIAGRLLQKEMWVGMTEQMVRDSLGSPMHINSSVYAWGRSAQWVYPDKYLYFDDGVLTSYQKREY